MFFWRRSQGASPCRTACQTAWLSYHRRSYRRRLVCEALEERRLLAGLPFGAQPNDTAEFMLGSVLVTPVFLESNGRVDASSEDWNSQHIQETLGKIDQAMDWWVESLARLNTVHQLSFVIDTTFATNPVSTDYEPINRISNHYTFYVSEFLDNLGRATGDIERDIRAFNHSQRMKFGTDWAFTIFVANSQRDSDGQFAAGGSFNRAFAFAGGLFMVVPSTRPASTFAHETGHMFWARDEYPGGGTYNSFRGYYNTQNLNAWDNPTPGFVQQPSLMAAGTLLETAYQNFTSAASTFAQIGWQDSNGNGIFDVLDVPSELTGTGSYDLDTGIYRFVGQATVKALANQNSWGLRNNITLNRIGLIEYRLDDGPWQIYSQPNQYQVNLDLNIVVPTGTSKIDIRARDPATTVISNTVTDSFRSPWQNPRNPFNVNDDHRISALDALLVINALNSRGGGELGSSGISPPPYLDVSGDGRLTSRDALLVINHLNSRNSGSGEASAATLETESSQTFGESQLLAAPPVMSITVSGYLGEEAESTSAITREIQSSFHRQSTVPAVTTSQNGLDRYLCDHALSELGGHDESEYGEYTEPVDALIQVLASSKLAIKA
ncbi:MAG: protein containing Planctomycete extracellular domain protein [Pirellulaceae bacterium]|nr:protein containing Planctomycete extracellular domain protein [Pirellulaceae bacterium]